MGASMYEKRGGGEVDARNATQQAREDKHTRIHKDTERIRDALYNLRGGEGGDS